MAVSLVQHQMIPRTRVVLAVILLAGLALRIGSAVTIPLLDGEAYYWLWSRNPALSYLDHPPLIAYLIRLTTVFGDDAIWVRLGPLIAGVITPLALFTLGREVFGARAGLIAAAAYQIVPVLSGGGLFTTPEAPLFLWWSLTLLYVRRALWTQDWWWIPAGIAIGLGMLSKIPMIALPVGILGFVLTRRRDVLRQAWAYVGALIAVALFTPVLMWNVGNGWAGVRFVLRERPQQVPLGLAGLAAIGVEQLAFALVLFPVLLWMLRPALRVRQDERVAFLLWMTVPTLCLFGAVVMFWGGAHGYWAGPAYLGLAVLLGGLWPGKAAALAMGANAALIAYAALVPLVPWLPAPPGTVESVAGWREVARRAEELAAPMPDPVLLAVPVEHFEGAAQLAYYTRRRRPTTVFPKPFKGSVWPDPARYPGASVVWVADAQWDTSARPERSLARVVERAPLPITMRGREVRRFRFWTGTLR